MSNQGDFILRILALTAIVNLLPILLFSAKLDSVYVIVSPPFPDTVGGIQGSAYKLLNNLHFASRDFTVLRLNPIPTGANVDSSSIAYAEAVLRSYPFWNEAKFTHLSPESTKWRLMVHDLWTTKINASFRYIAERGEWALGLEEENLLGLGMCLSAGYAHRINKNWWQFATILYGIPAKGWDIIGHHNQMGRQWETELELIRPQAYNPQGNLFFLSVRAESTRVVRYYSGAIPGYVIMKKFGQIYGEYLLRRGFFYFGLASGYDRRTYGCLYENDRENEVSQPQYTSMIWCPTAARFSLYKRKFLQSKNVDNFGRVEDIPAGIKIGLSVGTDIARKRSLSKTPNFCELEAQLSRMSTFYIGGLIKYRFFLTNISTRCAARIFLPADTLSLYRIGIGLDRWEVSASSKEDSEMSRYLEYLVADGTIGFRGFPPYYITTLGDEALYKLSGEIRIFPKIEFLTIRFGFAIFGDWGWIEPRRHQPTDEYKAHSQANIRKNYERDYLWDFGISLRLASTRSTTGNVNRFEISYSPQTKKISFTLDSGQAFSFFLPLEIEPLFSKK